MSRSFFYVCMLMLYMATCAYQSNTVSVPFKKYPCEEMIGPVPTTTICECTNVRLQFGEKFHLDKITRIACTCGKGVPFEHEKRDA